MAELWQAVFSKHFVASLFGPWSVLRLDLAPSLCDFIECRLAFFMTKSPDTGVVDSYFRLETFGVVSAAERPAGLFAVRSPVPNFVGGASFTAFNMDAHDAAFVVFEVAMCCSIKLTRSAFL